MAIDRISSTLTGDVSSNPVRIDENVDDAGSAIVGLSITGTWSGVTATLEGCADPTASPQVFAPVPDAAWTSNVADALLFPIGWIFRVTVSGSGSPLPSLTVTFTREVKFGGEDE